MTEYQHGEIVDVSFKGVRIFTTEVADVYRIAYNTTAPLTDGNSRSFTFTPDSANVTVERVASSEWPPQPGDLWRDRSGALHFAVTHTPDYDDRVDSVGIGAEGTRVVLIAQNADSSCATSMDFYRPENVSQLHGPLVLVYRKGKAVTA